MLLPAGRAAGSPGAAGAIELEPLGYYLLKARAPPARLVHSWVQRPGGAGRVPVRRRAGAAQQPRLPRAPCGFRDTQC